VEDSVSALPPRIAVLIPCLNEEITVGKVVADFRATLPEATVYVFDNGSTDRTAERARAAGALVVREKGPGKGRVVQSMLRKVDADLYVVVDGDDTYSAADARRLLAPLLAEQADMVVASRLAEYSSGSFRSLHVLGNRMLTGIVNWIFGARLKDMMSGYRALTRELAKSVPILSPGFEVETELTLRTLEAGYVIAEIALPYRERPPGSQSKLRTFSDGWQVAANIFNITRNYRPLTFYGALGALFLLMSLAAGGPVVLEFIETQYVTHVPLAILSTGCMILSFLCFSIGLVLSTVIERAREVVEVHLLNRR
jgi:glycosyltransferase involved in cell wall biosynthesis